nr:GNAT family N-acetyltransferase [Lacisediminihabitans changchengi]
MPATARCYGDHQHGFVLVALDASATPCGFAQVLEVDGFAHLEQPSVLPQHTRLGHGRDLLRVAVLEAKQRGYDRTTLRTFADIPWNAPFYATEALSSAGL